MSDRLTCLAQLRHTHPQDLSLIVIQDGRHIVGESVDHLQIAVAIVDHEEAKESVQAEITVK